MDSIDTARAERRARARYEWARTKRALLGFAPSLVIVAVAALLGRRPGWALGFGSSMFAMGVVLLWYGRDLRRAVLPGVAAGLVPLLLALCAIRISHTCVGDHCMALCLPACIAGGFVAGLAVAGVGLALRGGAAFWTAASAMSLLTGAMGCACLGYSGVVGLALGFAVGMVPGGLRRLFARTAQ